MSDQTLKAILTINADQFRAGLAASGKDLGSLQNEAKQTAAAVALMERELAKGGGSGAGKELDAMRDKHRALQIEIKNTARQQAALAAVTGAGVGDEGVGNNHGRTQMLAHSARATMDMMMAGQSPLQAAQMEAPRLLQAFGASLGSIIGIGAAVAGVSALASKTYEAWQNAKELALEFAKVNRGGPSQGRLSEEAATARERELKDMLAKNATPETAGKRVSQGLQDEAVSNWKSLALIALNPLAAIVNRVVNPGADVGAARDAARKESEQKLKEMRAARVAAQKDDNDARVIGETDGPAAADMATVRLRRQHALADIEDRYDIKTLRAQIPKATDDTHRADLTRQLDANIKASEAETNEANRRFDIEERIAALRAEDEQRQMNLRRGRAEIQEPNVKDGAAMFDTNLTSKRIETAKLEMTSAVDAYNARVKAGQYAEVEKTAMEEKQAAFAEVVASSRRELEAAESTTKQLGLQVTGHEQAARLEGLRASYAERIAAAMQAGDTALAEQLKKQQKLAMAAARGADDPRSKTPGQMNAELLAKQAAARTLAHGGGPDAPVDYKPHTRDVRREGSAIPEAGQGPNSARDADKMGGASYESPDNVRFLNIPNRVPDIQNGAENAGKSDGGGVNLEATNGYLERIAEAVEGLSFEGK